MKALLIQTLETICPNNVYLQGTLSESEMYPDNFITFWTDSTDDNEHFDDDVVSIDWEFTVIFYTNDPAEMSTKPSQIYSALKTAGFITHGKGSDIPSDRPSHTGWAMDFTYKEIL